MNAFSDGSPLVEFLVFALVLVLAATAVHQPRIAVLLDRLMAKLATFARERGALQEHGMIADMRRADLVRIAIGAIATIRYGEIMQQFLVAGDGEHALVAGTATVLAACVTIGLLTPLVSLMLMVSANLLIDNHLGASTLGTMVMSMGMLMLLLAPAGRTLSLDAWLARRGGTARRVVAALHRLSGPVSTERLLVAKLATLFSYFCVCVYSVSWHIHDEAWTSGLIVAWVLLSSGANPNFYQTAWSLYEAFPALYVSFSVVSIIGMAFWYVLVLPGLFMGRWVRSFVIYWGLAFFIVSTFVLPLRYLGWYELILWFAFFASGPVFGSASGPSVAILFDDRCNLCDRTVKLLSVLDLFGRLEFRPIRRNVAFAAAHGVTLEEGLTDLVGVDLETGSRTSGFDLYEKLSGSVLVLWLLKPVMVLGRLTRIGPVIYRWVADRRTKLFGVCEFSSVPDRLYLSPELDVAIRTASVSAPHLGRLLLAVIATLGVMSVAFLVRLPVLSLDSDKYPVASWSKAVFGSAPSVFGIHRINVFNEEDLSVFRFTRAVFGEANGHDRSDPAALNRRALEFVGSDAQIYHMAAHGRRMSRMNLGCDIDYFKAITPRLRNAYRQPSLHEPESVLSFQVSITTWPTSVDLWSFQSVERRVLPLCEARIDVERGQILHFAYLQPGVDEAIRQKGGVPVLAADNVDAALNYPCRIDGYFLWSLASARALLANETELAKALQSQIEQAYGRFAIDCFLDALRITANWPALTDEANLVASGDICLTGTTLFERLVNAPGGTAHLRDTIIEIHNKLKNALADGNTNECSYAAIMGWNSYMQALAERGGT